MSPLPISCFVRTLNEERRIGEVIRSAQQITDDVIIVDSGSTDKTMDIARELGATVIEQPWLGNGTQKRIGEDHTKNDWVLDIDADEVVSEELAAEIRKHFQTTPDAKTVFDLNVTIITPNEKRWIGFGGARRNKLYNKTFVRIPDHAAWDQFDVPDDAKVVKLHKPLWHYSFKNIAHMMRKMNRVSTVRGTETKLKSKGYLALRIIFGLPVYFLKMYIMRGLIRGGIYGFAFAMVVAIGRWLKDVKMFEIHLGIDPKA